MKIKKGQAAVELALVVPILLFLMCGIIDFGRILYTANTLNIISQESVRLAGLGKKDSEVKQYAIDNALVNPALTTSNITINPPDSTRKSGDYVSVTITYSISYITPLMDTILPSPYTITNKATMRVE
ncbi:MAG: TadE/TadG family type IV pilus assembly protein [Clostridiaceae bacterium]